jgi:hypothetical protein
MGKAQSKPLAGTARQGNGMGMAWDRRDMYEFAFRSITSTTATFITPSPDDRLLIRPKRVEV